MQRATVDLPEPDSPTMPSVSPAATLKSTFWPAYQAGRLRIVAAAALKPDPDLKDIPNAFELATTDEYRQLLTLLAGPWRYGRPIFAPPGSQPEAMATLRAAFEATMRDEEFKWEPYGPAMTMQVKGAVAGGRVVDWSYDVWSQSHNMRPGDPDGINLLGSWYLADAKRSGPARHSPQPNGAGDRNAITLYDFPRQRTTHHLIMEQPVRTSALRTLGAYANVFAIESFMDELATAGGIDPEKDIVRERLDPGKSADAIKDKINRAAAPSVEKLLQNPIYLDYAKYAKHKGKLVMQA